MDVSLLAYVPLLGFLVWAVITDIRARRISNVLTLALALTGLVQSFLPYHTVTPGMAFAGLGTGFGITFVLFAIGALGAGDVKLVAGVGAWVGPLPILLIFLTEKVIGLIIVIAQAAWQNRLRLLLTNTALVAVNLVSIRNLGVDHVSQTGQKCRSIDRPLPFAVPMFMATVLFLVAVNRAWVEL